MYPKLSTGREAMTDSSQREMHDPNTLLVVGVGRSGTSLLQSMLDAHPEISFLPETHFFRYYVARPAIRKRFERLGAESFETQLRSDDRFQRAKIEARDLLEPFLSGEAPLDLGEAYRRLLAIFRHGTGAIVAGDKDPRNIDYLRELKDVSTSAAIIHIIRDPRDVVLSRMKTEWSAKRPVWLNALVCATQYARGRSQLRRHARGNHINVFYERLIQSPRSTLEEITTFLGLEYAPQMVSNFGESAKRLTNSKEAAWKSNTLGPLNEANLKKWEKQLTPFQIAVVESICHQHFEHDVYALSRFRLHRMLVGPFCRLARIVFGLFYSAVVRFDLVRNPYDVIKIKA